MPVSFKYEKANFTVTGIQHGTVAGVLNIGDFRAIPILARKMHHYCLIEELKFYRENSIFSRRIP